MCVYSEKGLSSFLLWALRRHSLETSQLQLWTRYCKKSMTYIPKPENPENCSSLKKIIKADAFLLISPLLPKLGLHNQDSLPLGDEYVVRETLTGTTGMTWCLAHLIRILIGVCGRGFYKW